MEELTFICGIICTGEVKHFYALTNNSCGLSVEYFHKGSAKYSDVAVCVAVYSVS